MASRNDNNVEPTLNQPSKTNSTLAPMATATPTAANVVATRRTISPYDLTPSDNPGRVISQPLLRGNNYDEWSVNIRQVLKSRKKFGFVDGSIPMPDTNSMDFEDWDMNNSLIVSWIKNTLESHLHSDVGHREFTRDLWEYLKRRFGTTNAPRLLKIRSDLTNCRQHGMTIEKYFGKLTKLWDKLANFRSLKSCKCGHCTCDIAASLDQQRNEDRLYEFLLDLDETRYGVVRSNLLSRQPLPTLEEAYSMVTQDEDTKTTSYICEEKLDTWLSRFVLNRNRDPNPMTLIETCCAKIVDVLAITQRDVFKSSVFWSGGVIDLATGQELVAARGALFDASGQSRSRKCCPSKCRPGCDVFSDGPFSDSGY